MSSLQGADKLAARLRAISQTEFVVRDIVIHGVREAKLLVPHKTRNLSRTIRVGRVTATQGEVLAGGSPNIGYAKWVEEGTRPHKIRPKTKKALFFPSQKLTTDRFGPKAKLTFRATGSLSARSVRRFGNFGFALVTVVNHPGTKAQPYLVPGLKKAVAERGITAVVEIWNKSA